MHHLRDHHLPCKLPVMRRLALLALFVPACTTPPANDPAAPVAPPPAPAADVVHTPLSPVTPEPPAEDDDEDDDDEEEDDDDEEEDVPPEPGPGEPRPLFVMLGRGGGSHTSKPAANTVLGHSWGWGTRTPSATRACELANGDNVGKMMACGTEDKPAGAAALIDRLKLRPGKSVFVKPADIAGWDVAPPTEIWLIGPKRACKAAVGRPMVGYYSIDADGDDDEPPTLEDDFTILELAWELTGCKVTGKPWAPIGVAAASLDEALRWVPVKAGPRARFEPAKWTGILAAEIAALPARADKYLREEGTSAEVLGEWWMQTFELPGTQLREVFVGVVWRDPENSGVPGKYACGDQEFGEVFQIRLPSTTPLARGSRGHLVGGLVDATGEARWLVWSDTRDLRAARVEADTLGPAYAVSTGQDHPEDGGNRGYQLIGYCGP